jgi:type VI secretion system protein VasG
MDINLKGLIGRLNRTCTHALESAAGACMNRTHHEVTVEHLLSAMLEEPGADIEMAAIHFKVDLSRLREHLTRIVDKHRGGNQGRPVFSPLLVEWIQQAWLIASLDFNHGEVRSGVLLLALLANMRRFGSGGYDELLSAFSQHDLKKQFSTAVSGSVETTQTGASEHRTQADERRRGDDAITLYCSDFTAKARDGRIDPVFGRDREIRQIVDILARRRKNNPICVGEPGVGKTAVIEGLALRVIEGDIPDNLRGVRIVGLDLGLLQAGASVKGEFENRLKQVLEEIKSSPAPIVLFIDEAHTLIGAGGGAGTGDAANLLKPALARGELRTIAATTWAEYKKYFEKDAALARRFQPVKLDEPDIATTVTMLRGLRSIYEKSHQVLIRDDALVAAAELGARYITGRQHPDKGIDLVDTAAARVKVALTTKPPILQDAERRIQDLERALSALIRDRDTGGKANAESISDIERELAAKRDEAVSLTNLWTKELDAAKAFLAARQVLLEKGTNITDDQRKTLDDAAAALARIQDNNPLVHVEVTPEVLTKVIADWTGIPVGAMVSDQAKSLLEFETRIGNRIKGQDHALKIVGTGIRIAKSGIKDPRTPLGVFLLVGPSGVGKTETALGIADLLFGGERFMTTINMSEYQEKHSVSRLVGSPPGYVGYGEGGVLTEAVRQRPYSVVLLDEVEKADLEVMNLFYQVFDKGILSDGEGREIDFANTIILLTSNLATERIMQFCNGTQTPNADALLAAIRPELSRHFKPALLARMTIVPYFPINQNALREITKLKLDRLAQRLRNNHRVTLSVDDAVLDAIAARCTEAETGARNVDHIISATLTPRVSSEILARLGEGALPNFLHVGFHNNDFTIEFSDTPALSMHATS